MNNSKTGKSLEKKHSQKPKTTQKKTKLDSPEKKDANTMKDDGLLVETARKIESGAKSLGEKTADVVEKVSDQTTEIAELAYGKLKDQVSETYDAGTKTISDVSKKAGKYIKKYENTAEMKKLSHEKDKKIQEFGNHIYNLYKSYPKEIEKWLADEKSQNFLSELDMLNKEIVKLNRRIKRKI